MLSIKEYPAVRAAGSASAPTSRSALHRAGRQTAGTADNERERSSNVYGPWCMPERETACALNALKHRALPHAVLRIPP